MKQKSLIFAFALFLAVGAFGIFENSNVALGVGECLPEAQDNYDASGCSTFTEDSCTALCPSFCRWDTGTSSCVSNDTTGPTVEIPEINIIPKTSLEDMVLKLINILLSFLGFISVIITLYGGFVWMTSVGDEKKVSKAKEIISAGVIGIAIIMCSWGLASLVFKIFGVGIA
ncbi:MAG: pilin [Patescibacteria group bacterium]